MGFAVEQRISKVGVVNRFEHDDNKCSGPPCTAARCYSRVTDKHEEVRFVGVERLDDGTLLGDVTPLKELEAAVTEPTEQEKGDHLGEEILLRELERQENLLLALGPGQSQPDTRGRLESRTAQLRGMLR
jgi:hypothetical protein